jgi:periplasmic divalent cation tolerance protein
MLIVYTTCPNMKNAKEIAKKLVERRLAACVNIIKIEESVYRWKGKIVEEAEFLLIIKTTESKYSQVETEIKRIHEYELPEILAVKVTRGSKEYMTWVERHCILGF